MSNIITGPVKRPVRKKKRKPIKTGRKELFKPALVAEAIRKAGGIKSAAADMLKCARATIDNYIARYPEVADAYNDVEQRTFDMCEGKLKQAAQRGEPWAIQMILKTKGKARGYSERVEVDHSGDISVTLQNAAESLNRKIARLAAA